MMKRSYEEAFGNHLQMGDVLGQVTFKYLNQMNKDMSKSGFLPAHCNAGSNFSNCRAIDYEAFLNMEDCAVLAAAHDIEMNKESSIDQAPIEPREIKRVKRLTSSVNQQNTSSGPRAEEITLHPSLQNIDLEDKSFEKIEIEYLEKMSADCKFSITQEKAQVMKKYTDVLINAVAKDKSNELTRLKAENIVLKKAFKVQNEVVQKTRQNGENLHGEVEKLRQNLERTIYENQLMATKLREYQLQEFQDQNQPSKPSFGWGGDIAGF